jgi:hypothetical protein
MSEKIDEAMVEAMRLANKKNQELHKDLGIVQESHRLQVGLNRKLTEKFGEAVKTLKFYAEKRHLPTEEKVTPGTVRVHASGLVETGWRARETLKSLGVECE